MYVMLPDLIPEIGLGHETSVARASEREKIIDLNICTKIFYCRAINIRVTILDRECCPKIFIYIKVNCGM